jgi:hypothetical protein
VKGVYPRPSSGRGQMRERHRRDRALTDTLRGRYPQLISLRLEFGFRDSGPFTPAPQSTVMHPPARAYFFFPCPYDDCDGEFDLTESVRLLVQDEDATRDGQLRCCGQRSGAKGKYTCTLTLEFSLEADRGAAE